jgi:hypothetical protein
MFGGQREHVFLEVEQPAREADHFLPVPKLKEVELYGHFSVCFHRNICAFYLFICLLKNVIDSGETFMCSPVLV